jgi:hypothetical protein
MKPYKLFSFFLYGYLKGQCHEIGGGVNDIACTILRSKNRSYLGEFEAEFKKALALESGAQGVLYDEKNRGSKIS